MHQSYSGSFSGRTASGTNSPHGGLPAVATGGPSFSKLAPASSSFSSQPQYPNGLSQQQPHHQWQQHQQQPQQQQQQSQFGSHPQGLQPPQQGQNQQVHPVPHQQWSQQQPPSGQGAPVHPASGLPAHVPLPPS
mmetsp:Transcript_12420/g.37359  ORF Transcript_12420/g.37359 Transcript_12420/m.37359 type:complete len:134 (+) Transcript_12420:2041-2442(+)